MRWVRPPGLARAPRSRVRSWRIACLLRAWLWDLAAKDGRRGKPIAAGTVSQAYRTLNRVPAAAVDDELMGRNPLHGAKPPQVEPEPMRFLTHEEVATLADSIDARYRALVYVAAYTGLRAGELIALCWLTAQERRRSSVCHPGSACRRRARRAPSRAS
jgi:integrase